MPKQHVLIEVPAAIGNAFEAFGMAMESPSGAQRLEDIVLDAVAGFGVEPEEEAIAVPMLAQENLNPGQRVALEGFASSALSPDMGAETVVIAATVPQSKLDDLRASGKVMVWQNSALTLFAEPCGCGGTDLATIGEDDEDAFAMEAFEAQFGGGVDCRPFRAGVSTSRIRSALGVPRVWRDGFRGQNIIVGIIDEGVNGTTYPVVGGFSRPNAGLQPGEAPITSHGSMCAADILVAAPAARLYDYPFLGVPNSGGALAMFQAVLDQRRRDGTPHITNNSYGFVGVPSKQQFPGHEIWELNHPLHRKVREVVASGVACFFAAGNCGTNCPSGRCQPSGIGSGKSIHASNSLREVITVAAVNSRNERIGYSSQGPGMFEAKKPDISSYSHFFGNFGPGRPGGMAQPFDNGTSAATPVAAGVGALLLSAFPQTTPAQLKSALMKTAGEVGAPGWDDDHGQGVISAAAAYARLRGPQSEVENEMAALGGSQDRPARTRSQAAAAGRRARPNGGDADGRERTGGRGRRAERAAGQGDGA